MSIESTKTYSDENGTAAGVQFWAYRYPTDEEIEAGRGVEDMVEIGAYGTEHAARITLPTDEHGRAVGQIQINRDGEVYQYP